MDEIHHKLIDMKENNFSAKAEAQYANAPAVMTASKTTPLTKEESMTFEEMTSEARSTEDMREVVLIQKQYEQECKEVKVKIADFIYKKVKDTPAFKKYVRDCYDVVVDVFGKVTFNEWFSASIFNGKLNVYGMEYYLSHIANTRGTAGLEELINGIGCPEFIQWASKDKDVEIDYNGMLGEVRICVF